MYCDFFKNFDSTSIAIRYCGVKIFFYFFYLDRGKKLNDTFNIQTVIIKKHILTVISPVLFQFSVNINKQPQKVQKKNTF